MSDTSPTRRPGARAASAIALAATLLTGGGVAAQSPAATTAPAATSAPTTQTPNGTMPGPGGGMGRFGDQGRMGPGGRGPGMGSDFDGGWDRSGDVVGMRGPNITVTAIDGSNLTLQTADGWTRTIDTTGVVLTRDGTTIAITDILVGEPVRVAQTRNADGSYTVTGIEVQPAIVTGTVGTVSTDGFTVVGSDGTTTTVTVDASTTWSARGATSATIADATAGRPVAVEGQLQADGSIVATRVRLG